MIWNDKKPIIMRDLRMKLQTETKCDFTLSLIPIVFPTLMAVFFTASIFIFFDELFFLIFSLLLAICFWTWTAFRVRRAVKLYRIYQQACQKEALEIVTDQITALTQEEEHQRDGMGSRSETNYVIYLEKYGRHVILRPLWNQFNAGDEVYVVIVHCPQTRIYWVYHASTHWIVEG